MWRLLAPLLGIAAAFAQQLPSTLTSKIDEIAVKALADSGAPSASFAVVRDGKIAFEKAYGKARLDPPTGARASMRYPIGSISKQFTAAAVLLLVEDGKLSLDDRVSRYLPDLSRANEVNIRQLLGHVSGYQDFYPQNYVPPYMQKPITPAGILNQWARKPLDFDPGASWQYSNTNYVIAGQIVEKVSKEPLFSFISKRILQPLGITTALDLADRTLASSDPLGYTRFGFGSPRPVAPEGRGWLYAAGELGMTAHDLAVWDISLIDRQLLKPASFDAFTTPIRLRNGATATYALGVQTSNSDGHLVLEHDGGVAGFVSLNIVWPDQRAAIVVFSNMDGSSATGRIAGLIAPLLLTEAKDPDADASLEQARKIFDALLDGKIDRTLLAPDADAFFTPQVLADASSSLKSLRTPTSFRQIGVEFRGGMTYRHFLIRFQDNFLRLDTLKLPDGKLEQYLIH